MSSKLIEVKRQDGSSIRSPLTTIRSNVDRIFRDKDTGKVANDSIIFQKLLNDPKLEEYLKSDQLEEKFKKFVREMIPLKNDREKIKNYIKENVILSR